MNPTQLLALVSVIDTLVTAVIRIWGFAIGTKWRKSATLTDVANLLSEAAQDTQFRGAIEKLPQGRRILRAIQNNIADYKGIADAVGKLDGNTRRALYEIRIMAEERRERAIREAAWRTLDAASKTK